MKRLSLFAVMTVLALTMAMLGGLPARSASAQASVPPRGEFGAARPSVHPLPPQVPAPQSVSPKQGDNSPAWQSMMADLQAATDSSAQRSGPLATSRGPAALASLPLTTLPTCFPTCSPDDGKMLIVAGSDLETLAGQSIEMEFVLPATAAQLRIDIFDGDNYNGRTGEWDIHNAAANVETLYTLYADPLLNGTGTQQVAQFSSTVMPNSAWYPITQAPLASTAQAGPGALYGYRMIVTLVDPTKYTANGFKIATNAQFAIERRSFAFVGALYTPAEAPYIYPSWPSYLTPAPTTYTGDWTFYFQVPGPQTEMVFWDGDFDFGARNCSTMDTNDANTTSYPSWVVGSVSPQGVAVGTNFCPGSTTVKTTGAPEDDDNVPIAERQYSVTYWVVDPRGISYRNTNPSGNREWEQFRISTDPLDTMADVKTNTLPGGVYRLVTQGLDLSNLNSIHTDYCIVGMDAGGFPVSALWCASAAVGDFVWEDVNHNGLQDIGEPGVAGATVTLLDGSGNPVVDVYGNPVLPITTGANGAYLFQNLVPGTYTVKFGAPAGYVFTTQTVGGGSNGATDSNPNSSTGVTAPLTLAKFENNTTIDAGLYRPAHIGDYVWFDFNDDGIQNDLAQYGLNNVVVQLLDASGNVVDTTTTASDVSGKPGYYQFTLAPGTYSVKVADVNFQAGGVLLDATPSPAGQGSDRALDSNGGANHASELVTVLSGGTRLDIDFGFFKAEGFGSAELGNQVWFDRDADGVFDAGETAISGVTVELWYAPGCTGNAAGCNYSVKVGTTTTNGGVSPLSGNYSFDKLSDGYFKVVIPDGQTALSGLVKTQNGTPNTDNNSQSLPYFAQIQSQISIPWADFGYKSLGSLELAKNLTGGPAGYTGPFVIHYDCGTGFIGNRTVSAGGSATIGNIPGGTSCTVSEPSLPTVTGYNFGTPSFSPAATAVIPMQNGSSVKVTTNNTLSPVQGNGRLLPTQTTCQDYLSGSYTLYDAFTYNGGGTISSISPGVIFYFNTVKAPAASFALKVSQTNSSVWKPMLWHQAQASLLDSSCGQISSGVTITAAGENPYGVTYNVTGATPGATYIIQIKYSPKNLEGQSVVAHPTSTYFFSTLVDGNLQPGSQNQINVLPK